MRMKSDDWLIRRAFLLSAWGPSPDSSSELKDIEQEVRSARRDGGLVAEVNSAKAAGEMAYALAADLAHVVRSEGETRARAWINDRTSLVDPRIEGHLLDKLKKAIRRREIDDLRREQARQSSNVHVTLVDGRHPNSLRLQEPSTDWNIYIDETGRIFDESARQLSAADRTVGKVVALAVPARVVLEPLGGFHATDNMVEQVDNVVQRVLDAPVGILGVSVQSDAARNNSWIGHVLHLIRWTLLQLPVPEGAGDCQIHIHIEKRGQFDRWTDLKVVREALAGEMAALDSSRFANIKLKIEFIGKDHPMNGYVDAVAYTWGSPLPASKDRLERSQLRGHCLVDADEVSLHHLYLALSQHGPLAPLDWYTLCAAAASEPLDSFLSRSLESLGQELQQHPAQWQGYIDEVQVRLRSKRYVLSELRHAIAWLQRFAGTTQVLPSILQLQLSSSNLALANHQGDVGPERIAPCIGLVKELHDEAPDLACEAILRMASALTNNFEFGKLDHVIDEWLDYPVAVAGLLNYGKLQSSRGQSLAFQGKAHEALPFFDLAIASFERLSDPAQAERESRQTDVYRLIALVDDAFRHGAPGESSELVRLALSEIVQHFDSRNPEEISRKLATSRQDERFAHHLWLRALVYFPNEMALARESYMQEMAQWQDGRDHPWPLIQAYRGWLLHEAGYSEAARQRFEQAISACEDASHGSTLMWMSQVLRLLVLALGFPEGVECDALVQRDELKKLLPAAPHAALSVFAASVAGPPMARAELLSHLDACLPFNFH